MRPLRGRVQSPGQVGSSINAIRINNPAVVTTCRIDPRAGTLARDSHAKADAEADCKAHRELGGKV